MAKSGYLAIQYRTLAVNKMALPIEVSAEMVSYSYFYWKKYDCNWVTIDKASQQVLLQYVLHTAETDKVSLVLWSMWVKISGHTELLRVGPCGSTSHFVNIRHSRVKTQGASCIGGFGQTDGQRKIPSWEFPKVGVRLIIEVQLILETRR